MDASQDALAEAAVAIQAAAVTPLRADLSAAFGPAADQLAQLAADLDRQRTWERQHESQLAFHEAELTELRDYVHELERRLGTRPPGRRPRTDRPVRWRPPTAR